MGAVEIAENCELKSLIVTVVGGRMFSSSGELEGLFPAGGQVNLSGKTASKSLKDGKTECTITILAGLTDLSDCSARIEGKNVLLKLYSKKGVMLEI